MYIFSKIDLIIIAKNVHYLMYMYAQSCNLDCKEGFPCTCDGISCEVCKHRPTIYQQELYYNDISLYAGSWFCTIDIVF